jgi:hypothetical protein
VPATLATHLGNVVPSDGDGAVALNTALMADGALIRATAASTVSGRCMLCSPPRTTNRRPFQPLAGGD